MIPTRYLKGPCRQCGGKIEFPVEMVGTTIDCPHCGQPTELLLAVPPQEPSVSRRAIVLAAVAVLIVALGAVALLSIFKRAERLVARKQQQRQQLAAATNVTPPAPVAEITNVPPPKPKGPAAKAGFQASHVTLEKGPGSSLVYATGTLTNSLDHQRFGVRVELDLFDHEGNKLGTAKDYAQVIEPGAGWRFKALVMEPKAARAKIASVKEDQP